MGACCKVFERHRQQVNDFGVVLTYAPFATDFCSRDGLGREAK
jgi:hypothetical protein